MAERPAFQRHQYAFAAHIRDPENNPAPTGIEDRRMAIYRSLFFNNVSQLLAKTFPVLHAILGAEAWERLMRDYFSRHQSHTPLFLEMPREFLKYLEEERGTVAGDPPFQLELAHYEWVELALSIDERQPDPSDIDPQGDLLAGRPVLTPLMWSLRYRFPVHRLGPDYQPEDPPEQPTLLLVHRNLSGQVGFIEINIVTARLLELLGEDSLGSGRAVLERIADEMSHPTPDAVIDGGAEILRQLREREVILGTGELPRDAV
ncbi:MAG: putative DNA-binding domain-containing protein [Gammaproteobacteria bacterium]|jgi:hypothetical protein